MKFDFKVFLSVDLDKAIVDNRLVTLHDGTHEIAHHLETDWCSIFNLDVEVSHRFSSLFGLHNYTELDFFFACLNDSMDYASFCGTQTFALCLDIYFERAPVLSF